ncbi:MAG: alpha/beta fold hydrolase [Nitritalea sp.]
MKLAHKTLGNGPVLVILHGLFGSADNWLSIARELEESFSLVLVDQRNHGDSPHSSTWNYSVMAEDLAELLDDLGHERIYLMGHSMGGKTAMRFATQYPERVEKLLVADIAPRAYPIHHQEILAGLNAVEVGRLSSRKEADEQLAQHISHKGIRQFLLKALARDEQKGFKWRINLPVITEKIEEVGQALPDDARFEGSTLFMGGANSDYIREEDKALIQTHFPNSNLIYIKQAGHWLHAEQPDAVIQTIKAFFK